MHSDCKGERAEPGSFRDPAGFVFSRDGKHLVCGATDGTVRLWDVDTGMEVRRFEGHTGPVHGVAISPDADLIVTGGEDATIRLWDRRTGKEIKQFGR